VVPNVEFVNATDALAAVIKPRAKALCARVAGRPSVQEFRTIEMRPPAINFFLNGRKGREAGKSIVRLHPE
jgi:hypothetical protein